MPPNANWFNYTHNFNGLATGLAMVGRPEKELLFERYSGCK